MRDIPLPPIVVSALKAWRLACPNGPLGLVFPNGVGRVQGHANLLHRVFWPLQVQAGVVKANGRAKYSLHALRHAAGAMWIEQGFNAKRLQTLMGHSSIVMTMDVYGYLLEDDANDAAGLEQVEKRLLG